MILRFREGSALHAELKRMYDVREATYKKACDIVEKLVGERPEVFGYRYGFDCTCIWNPHMVAFKDGFVPDPRLMTENKQASTYEHKAYKILRTYKAGREAADEFKKFNSVYTDGFLAGVEWANRWINVEDELPEVGRLVLVKEESMSPNTDETVKTNIKGYELAVWNGCEWQLEHVDKPTHWRPIEKE